MKGAENGGQAMGEVVGRVGEGRIWAMETEGLVWLCGRGGHEMHEVQKALDQV